MICESQFWFCSKSRLISFFNNRRDIAIYRIEMHTTKKAFSAACVFSVLYATPALAQTPHPPYCEPRTAENVAANNIAPIPLGIVDNFSDDPPGLPLPPGQITQALAVDSSGKRIAYKWGDAVWLEPSIGCKQVGQTFDFYPATNGATGNSVTLSQINISL
jgi:hypothetical protein